MRELKIIAVILMLVAAATDSWAASVDGITLNWNSAGSGAQAVIFVHGWTCDDTSWQGQVQAISQKYRVITLDLPGHGKSGSPKDGRFSMNLFARAVEAVRSEAKVEKAVLVGHSMGTPVIREYALMYPQRVAGLVLVDGLIQIPGMARPAILPMTGGAGLAAREMLVRSFFGPKTSPELQQKILKMTMGTKEATADGAMTATWDPVHMERRRHIRSRAGRLCRQVHSRQSGGHETPLSESRVSRDSRNRPLPDDGTSLRNSIGCSSNSLPN
jgi:pimeloyl-ACP methyl ester carboxylesterase